VPYAVNAVTFLVSAGLIARIPKRMLQSEEPLTRGHWRDVADGFRLVLTAMPLRTVLVVWNVVLVGAGAVNLAEVFFVKDTLNAGDVGFGAIIAASGLGLVIGSFLAPMALGKVGLRRHYVGSIALMGVGWGGAALSGSIWVAVPFVVGGAAGNGAAVICNRLLVQRGAPDRYRGRALATIMSSNYAILGLSMAVAGVLVNVYDARTIWIAASLLYLTGAVVALVMTRWLPVARADEWHVVEASSESAVAALDNGHPVPGHEPVPNGEPTPPLERIATLLEEIEARRAGEARRPS
jgi:MFS family permease